MQPTPPLALASSRVHSVSPDTWDLRDPEMRGSKAPIWIIGGGKTAMDTAHLLIKEYPGRSVNLVAGSGTYFSDRERMYPRRRWTQGTRPNALIKQWRLWDGTNDEEFREKYKQAIGTWVTPTAENWLSGILSATEAEAIRRGLDTVLMDHLVDAEDQGSSVSLALRSGDRLTIPTGSWVVNCTGYLWAADANPYEPYVSATGNVASINQRSSTMLYSSHAGYFVTELLLRDKLHTAPLYEVDAYELKQRSSISAIASIAVLIHNLSVVLDELPLTVFLRPWGTDFDRVYPMPRWMWGALHILATHRADRRHAQQTLDTLRGRLDIRCGPLQPGHVDATD